MLIKDDILGLFPFEPEDSTKYREWVNSEDFATLLGRATPVTELQHQTWYKGLVSHPDHVVFAVRNLDNDAYLGNVWLHAVHWVNRNAELRILLGADDARGKGYGTRACQLLLRFAFEKLGLHKVYLYVSAANPRAHRSFLKAGFQDEGLLVDEFYLDGAFVNVHRMAVLNPARELTV